jgi:hypothetical protein
MGAANIGVPEKKAAANAVIIRVRCTQLSPAIVKIFTVQQTFCASN